MPIRIISLVFLFVSASISTTVSAGDSNFIYPKKKPSVFKKINKKILPIEKPNTSKKIIKIDKNFLLPENKPTSKKNKIGIWKGKFVEPYLYRKKTK